MKHKLIIVAMMLTAFTAFKKGENKMNMKTEIKTSQITYEVDTAKSNFEWTAKKVTGEHSGNVKISSGRIIWNKGMFMSGQFEMDMTTIATLNMDEGMSSKLVRHLKSEDFFNVEKFPKAAFKIKVWTPRKDAKAGEANYLVKGDLTIKGITNEISFPARVDMKEKSLAAIAEFAIDRTLYDIKFRSGKFFPDIGDKMIEDNFNVKITLAADVKN